MLWNCIKLLCTSKIFKIMRNILILLLFTVFQVFAESSYSQNTKLTMQLEEVSVSDILDAIEEQSEFYFLCNKKLVDINRKVSIFIQDEDINTILAQVFTGTDVDYVVMDRQIVLSPSRYLTEAKSKFQPLTVTGVVTDENGDPLPGLSIRIEGTTRGTVTNLEGEYTIEVQDPSSVLIFSFVGYTTQEVVVGNQTVLNITLNQDIFGLDEVVVIGYGTAKKADLTGSVASVSADDYNLQSMTQVTDMLTGTVAGFYAIQGTSAAGGSSMEIRGPTSLTAETDPMIVLDGVIYTGSLRDINPNDIETIDILKDASSAAIFGAKAASGIVLITTTKGRISKPTINFSTKIGMAEPAQERLPLSPEEFIQFRKDWFRTDFPDKPYHFYTEPENLPSDVSIEEWRAYGDAPLPDDTDEWMARMRFFPIEQENYLAGRTINWYDVVMRQGLRQDYDLSLSGGTEQTKYYWSIGYVDNEGIRVGDDYSVWRSRINLEHKVAKWLDVGINAQWSDRNESSVPGSWEFFTNSPYGRMFDEEGNLERLPHGHTDNPLLDYYRTDRLRKVTSLFANLYADFKLPLGITYRFSFQPRYEGMRDYQFISTDKKVGGVPADLSESTREQYSYFGWMIDNLIKWNREIGIHSFDVTLLANFEESQGWSSSEYNKNFLPNEQLSYHGIQFGDGPTISSDDSRSTGDALMARLNYTLLGRYLLTASVRRDGYSAFGQEHPRATFPAVAAAWQISEEDFFNIGAINRMKLRLSWGVNGNRDIGIYSALARLGSNLWFDGSSARVGVYNSTLSNPGLRWERTESINVGLDMGFFENRIDLSLDYYDMTTTDLLMNRILPKITGFTSITSNLGELGNKGFEMTLNTVNMSKQDVTWRSSLVFSLNRNKIKKLFGDIGEYTLLGKTQTGEVPDYSNEWFPGEPIDVVWNYDRIGIWQVNEADEAAEYNMVPGDFKSVDVDGDGEYIDLLDKQFIGYTSPRYRLGLRNDIDFLKHFTASIFIRADLGHIGPYSNALNAGFESNDRRSRNVGPVPYWIPENPINDYARLNVNTAGYGGGFMYYADRSFVRIQDVSIAYNLPSAAVQRIHLKSMRVFVSSRNLATFTKWPGWDPETGNFPVPRTYTLGVNIAL